jgi:hypothetical protein
VAMSGAIAAGLCASDLRAAGTRRA